MEKLLAMNIAATLTAGVVANLPDNLAVDANIENDTLRAENLMAWELFRIFYHAVKGAVEDEQSWPTPKVNFTPLLSNVGEKLLPLLTGSGPLAGLVQKLIDAIPLPPAQAKPQAPLPNPGTIVAK